MDVTTSNRLNDLIQKGPIKDPEELLRRANIVVYNHLIDIQDRSATSLFGEGYGGHAETKQVIATSLSVLENIKRIILEVPAVVFDNPEPTEEGEKDDSDDQN